MDLIGNRLDFFYFERFQQPRGPRALAGMKIDIHDVQINRSGQHLIRLLVLVIERTGFSMNYMA